MRNDVCRLPTFKGDSRVKTSRLFQMWQGLRIFSICASLVCGAVIGAVFFVLRESPESAVVIIKPATLAYVNTGLSGYRSVSYAVIAPPDKVRTELKNNFTERCSGDPEKLQIFNLNHDDLYRYTFQRTSGKGSFRDTIQCAVEKMINDHQEIVNFLATERAYPLPKLLAVTERTQLVMIADETRRLHTLNVLRSVVVGAIAGVIALLGFGVLRKLRHT